MACLTRKLQQNLTRYLQKHQEIINGKDPEDIRNELVARGLCSSDVTPDQVSVIMRGAQSC